MEKYRPYPCQQCGSCCRHVDVIEEMKKYDRGDGVCLHLNKNNKCNIYNHRPPLCNGQWVYEHYYSDMTVADFHRMVKKFCKKIQE
ncbi:YkgJ family cysteine cluster protein [Megasphaera elsdenii]|uniref:YkgJ family cysteine cluster protein n=1 Tax=Megasphaera elsdenii TaxID=907 RepID=UPI000934C595|nr:hypothetical protein [Megasphaera elsdenii]